MNKVLNSGRTKSRIPQSIIKTVGTLHVLS